MKKERKEALVHMFPDVPQDHMTKMQKSGSHNYAIFLTRGRELFVRCFHHYSRGGRDALAERQRYVFAKDGYVRYGSNDGIRWEIRTKFREPRFAKTSYGYNFDNSYRILGYENIAKSDMRYSQADKYNGSLLMSYLAFYVRHPNIEYLMKQGYADVIASEYYGYWGAQERLTVSERINWKSNDLLKMLGLNRDEFKMLQGREQLYDCYCGWRDRYPDMKADDLMKIADIAGYAHGSFDACAETAGSPKKLLKYLLRQNIENINDFKDYLDQCRRLNYDLSDSAVIFPRDFAAKHDELTAIELMLEQENKDKVRRSLIKEFKARMKEREKLCFSYGGLMLRQPGSMKEIATEGAKLSHCVAGYADRHASGVLTIMFLRRSDSPDTPYYTMEVSNDLEIVQCRGYKNNREERGGEPKPEEIKEFEKAYQKYLDRLKARKERESA